MAGIRFRVRTAMAEIQDAFNRLNGPISGSITPVGGRTWQVLGANTTVPGIDAQTVKATSGTGNTVAAVDTGATDYTILATVAALDVSPIPQIIFRGVDNENQWGLLLRQNPTENAYNIRRRVDGVGGSPLWVGPLPAVGDRVKIVVAGGTVDIYVNGAKLTEASVPIPDFPTGTLVGFNVNGADTVSAFDDLLIYTN